VSAFIPAGGDLARILVTRINVGSPKNNKNAPGTQTFPQIPANYQIAPKGIPPTGPGPLGARTNNVREPFHWFDLAVLFDAKNYRPPHPIGVKGGCSPQNNREKTSTLLNEFSVIGNKF
jgi:hypothetical protein